jgi:hypothetical protein
MPLPAPALAKETSVLEPGFTPPPCGTGAYAESRNAEILERSTTSLQLMFHRPTRSGDCPGTYGYSCTPESQNPSNLKSTNTYFYHITCACVKKKIGKHAKNMLIFTHISE